MGLPEGHGQHRPLWWSTCYLAICMAIYLFQDRSNRAPKKPGLSFYKDVGMWRLHYPGNPFLCDQPGDVALWALSCSYSQIWGKPCPSPKLPSIYIIPLYPNHLPIRIDQHDRETAKIPSARIVNRMKDPQFPAACKLLITVAIRCMNGK